MTRKKFIESTGATCRNWNWSWSFINQKKKTIIFGVWEDRIHRGFIEVMNESWEYNLNRRKQAGYKQSKEHLRLIEEKAYKLKIFYMVNGNLNGSPARIKSFSDKLFDRQLIKKGKQWRAVNK